MRILYSELLGHFSMSVRNHDGLRNCEAKTPGICWQLLYRELASTEMQNGGISHVLYRAPQGGGRRVVAELRIADSGGRYSLVTHSSLSLSLAHYGHFPSLSHFQSQTNGDVRCARTLAMHWIYRYILRITRFGASTLGCLPRCAVRSSERLVELCRRAKETEERETGRAASFQFTSTVRGRYDL